eukprot:366501-Chlamydomonas_euryale.AAC.24
MPHLGLGKFRLFDSTISCQELLVAQEPIASHFNGGAMMRDWLAVYQVGCAAIAGTRSCLTAELAVYTQNPGSRRPTSRVYGIAVGGVLLARTCNGQRLALPGRLNVCGGVVTGNAQPVGECEGSGPDQADPPASGVPTRPRPIAVTLTHAPPTTILLAGWADGEKNPGRGDASVQSLADETTALPLVCSSAAATARGQVALQHRFAGDRCGDNGGDKRGRPVGPRRRCRRPCPASSYPRTGGRC